MDKAVRQVFFVIVRNKTNKDLINYCRYQSNKFKIYSDKQFIKRKEKEEQKENERRRILEEEYKSESG